MNPFYEKGFRGPSLKEKEVVLQILGMYCTACATGIESGLKRLDGVLEASVNFATKETVVKSKRR